MTLEQHSRNQIPPSYPPASGGKAPSRLAGRVGKAPSLACGEGWGGVSILLKKQGK
jgi:hypothetical protein